MSDLVPRSPRRADPRACPARPSHAQVSGLSRRTLLRAALATGVGLWVVEVIGGTAAFAWSAVASITPKVKVGTLADLVAANPGAPDPGGVPGLRPGGARVRHPRRPGAARLAARRGPDRRRHGPERPGAVAALPAPRLPAEPVRRGLLVPLPVPPVALRPARDQAGGRAASVRRRTAWIASRSSVDAVGHPDHRHGERSRSAHCRSPSASPASSRRASRTAAREIHRPRPALSAFVAGSLRRRDARRARGRAAVRPGTCVDLVRGALDAWLHPGDAVARPGRGRARRRRPVDGRRGRGRVPARAARLAGLPRRDPPPRRAGRRPCPARRDPRLRAPGRRSPAGRR